jgi:hypothetical protein
MPDSTLTPEQTQALLQQLLSDGKTPPAKLGDLELVRDPTTQQPIAYRDPNTGSTISIPQPTTTTRAASEPSKWSPVYRTPNDPSSGQIGQWDPVNNEFHPQAAAPDAKPTGVYDPVVVGTGDAARQVGMVDQGDKSFHPLAAPPDAKPSGTYDNVYVTNTDGTKRLVGMTDTGDKHFIPVSADPTTQKRTIQTPTAIYSVDDNDNVKKLIDIDKSSPYQAVVIDGVAYRFDPNEKDPTKAFTQVGPNAPLPQTIKDAAGNTLVLTDQPDGSKKYALPPGVKPAATLNVNTTARTLDYRDDQGNLVKSVENPNYQAPRVDQPNLPAPNAVVSRILVPDPDNPGKFKWIDNEGRVTASQALQNLASSLSGHVVDGKISVDEAKAIIDGANTSMQTATTAASQALQGVTSAAQTGAGLLQNRVTAGTGALNNIVSAISSGKMMGPAPANFGQNIVGGLSEWVTQLGGGQPVYDSAAAMVNQANPVVKGDPTMAQQAYTALRGMMDLYKQKTGRDWQPGDTGKEAPFTAPSPSAGASPAPGGVAPPSTVVPGPPAAPGAGMGPMNVMSTPGMNVAAMPGAGPGGAQSTPVPGFQMVPAPTMPFGAIGANPMLAAQQAYQPIQPLPIPQAYQFRAPGMV